VDEPGVGHRGTQSTAVLLMAYGTPGSPEAIEPYYTDIRHGRRPTPDELDRLVSRYDAIGGTSPLGARTAAQRDALQDALDRCERGRFRVVLGLKHAEPTIEGAIDELARANVDRIVALVLAPHFSALSVGEYLDRARRAAASYGIAVRAMESWAVEPAFVTFLAREVRSRLARMPPNTKVLFTAHSLPRRILDAGDRYPDEVYATAAAVAREAGLVAWSQWAIAWQSASRRAGEPWLGPDVLQVVDELAGSENADGLLVCACGFVADHLEVLYDLDIETRQRAEQAGLLFDRTACVNDDAAVMAALAERVRAVGSA
jgi:protoporphyrin/coproporphyrin ferrochelatase